MSYRIRNFYYQAGHYLPMPVDDLPVLEHFCRRILEVGGPRQAEIQEILLRMIGATAVPQSVPFLQETTRAGHTTLNENL